MKNELKLISMDTVETENVQWLWYPYTAGQDHHRPG